MSVTVGDIEKLQRALAFWDEVADDRNRFIDENQDPDGGDPLCGYQDWDEAMTDYSYDLAERGEALADAIREVIGR